VGFLPLLDRQTMTLDTLDAAQLYTLVPEGGLRQAHADDRGVLNGTQWTHLQTALQDNAPFTTTLRACAEMMAELKPQLRHLLHYHCGVRTLRSRQMMLDIQAL
jgi:DNA repair protein RecO (recombination protein O)